VLYSPRSMDTPVDTRSDPFNLDMGQQREVVTRHNTLEIGSESRSWNCALVRRGRGRAHGVYQIGEV